MQGDPGELLRCEVQLVRRLGAAEDSDRRVLVEGLPEAGRGAVERLVPARGPQISVLADERVGQPGILHGHEPSVDAGPRRVEPAFHIAKLLLVLRYRDGPATPWTIRSRTPWYEIADKLPQHEE